MGTAIPTTAKTHPLYQGTRDTQPCPQTRNPPKTGAAEGLWTEVDLAGLGISGREPRTGCV